MPASQAIAWMEVAAWYLHDVGHADPSARPEVVDQFEAAFGFGNFERRTVDGKGRVDLRAAVQAQLTRVGVSPDRIDTTDRCTFRDRDEFFSHRRDKGITGRMAALIAPRV